MKISLFKKTNYTEKISFSAYMVAVYFLMLPMDIFAIEGIGSVLRVLVFIPLIACLFRFKKWVFRFDALTSLILVYLVYLTISLSYTISSDLSSTMIMTYLLNLAFVLFVGSVQTFNKREISLFRFAFMLSGLLTVLLTFCFMGFGEGLRLVMMVNGKKVDANTLNGYILFLFVFFIDYAFRKKKIWWALPTIPLLVFVVFTGSRGALIAFIVMVLLSFIWLIKKSKRPLKGFAILLVVLAVGSVIFAIILPYIPQHILDRFTLDNMAGGTGRFTLWKNLLNYFSNSNPLRQIFGNGVGTVEHISGLCYGEQLVGHNIWIDELINGGIVGLGILLAIQITALVWAIKSKNFFLICSLVGFFALGMSLSLGAFKPLWCVFLMILAVKNCNVYAKANGTLRRKKLDKQSAVQPSKETSPQQELPEENVERIDENIENVEQAINDIERNTEQKPE